MSKRSKESVHYSRGMKESRCKNCIHFQHAGANGCEEVLGDIDPEYWCDLFKMARKDSAMTIRAAGILIVSKNGKALFLKRGPGGDMPGLWAFPGGRLEEGEEPIDAAIRETMEEAGYKVDAKALVPWTRAVSARETTGAQPTPAPGASGPVAAVAATPAGVEVVDGAQVDFTTFLLKGVDEFSPVLGPADSPEHVAFAWAPLNEPPEPIHPGCAIALAKCSPTFTELDVAKSIRDGVLTSPQRYENISLFALRITGTGQAYRSGKKDANGKILYEAEHVWRDPSLYLNPEFLERCNGLPVIVEHPKATMLDSKEFNERIAGTIMLPYIAGEEVWGIAKIYDAATDKLLREHQLSTSPAVLWGNPEVNQSGKLENGDRFLIEDKPSLVDHLAICWQGVWDKGGEPTGVISVRGDDDMTLEEIQKAHKEQMDKVLTAVNGLTEGIKVVAGRQDSIETYFANVRAREAKARVASFKFSKRKPGESVTDYSARHDAEEEELRKDAEEAGEEKEKAAKSAKDKRRDAEKEEEEGKDKKADARRRSDSFKFGKRGDEEDDDKYKERMDAEEKKLCADMEEAGEEAAADKARKRRDEAEEEDRKDRKDRKDARGDSVSRADFDDLKAKFDALQGGHKPRTDDEINAFGKINARADEIYSLMGQRAPAPALGQSLLAYKHQLAADLKKHSPTFKDSELTVAAADEKLFNPVFDVIMKEALDAAKSPATVKPGELRMRTIRLDSGHVIKEFDGQPDTWMGPLSGSVRQTAKKFILPKSGE